MNFLRQCALVLALLCLLSGCSSKSAPENDAGKANLNANISPEEAKRLAQAAAEKVLPLFEEEQPDAVTSIARRISSEKGDEEALRQNIREVDRGITYAHLKKNADRYVGRPWAFTGKILEIYEKDNLTNARVSLDDWGTKPVWVVAPVETDFLEGDRVYVIGYLGGSYTYTSEAGWTLTVPLLLARNLFKPAEAAKYAAKAK